jgi:pimeloyl-ACP methyl ester carboxylesterase
MGLCERLLLAFWLTVLTALPALADSEFVRKAPGNEVAVVFVHGVFGDATSTWTNSATKAYWPELLKDDPAFSNASIYVFEYPTSVFSQNLSINEIAEVMQRTLDADGVLDHKRLVFVMHSMGGLVVRDLIVKFRDDLRSKIQMLFFCSTPTTGSAVAKLGVLLRTRPQLGHLLPMNSDSFLADLQRDWLDARFTFSSYCAYEGRDTYGVRVVEQQSATNLCTEPLTPVDANHIDIVKPANRKATIYKALAQAFKRSSPPPFPSVKAKPATEPQQKLIVHAYIEGEIARVMDQPFSQSISSESVNFGCEQTVETHVEFPLPDGAQDVGSTAHWNDIDHAKSHNATVEHDEKFVRAKGSITGVDKQFFNCPGGGHGTLVLDVKLNTKKPERKRSPRVEIGSSELAFGEVSFPFPVKKELAVDNISVEIRQGNPAAKPFTVDLALNQNGPTRAQRQAFGQKFLLRVEGDTVYVKRAQ